MTDLQLFRMSPPVPPEGRCAGTIAICTRDEVKAGTATSWMMTSYGFLSPDEYVSRYFIQGNILTMQRNACIGEMEGDWIIFIDDDMTFQPDAVGRLVKTAGETGADMVGGLCFQRGEPYQPTLYMRKEGAGYTFMETWTEGEVIEVDATGLAFSLIRVDAFRKLIGHQIGEPWEQVEWPDREVRRKRPPGFFSWRNEWGEDFQFCQDLKAAGGKIVVDTGIEIGHIGEHTITKETFWREIAFRDPDTEQAKRELNDTVGLGTMTREEALERLGLR